jgi:hypothetical protein
MEMDLKEFGCDIVDWTHVAWNRGQCVGSCEYGSYKKTLRLP